MPEPTRLGATVSAAIIVLVLTAAPAVAHKLKLFAAVDGSAIGGTAYYSGGGRSVGVIVRVFGPDGAPLGQAVTDDEGRFRVAVAGAFDHHLVVESGDGHRAEVVIPAAALAGGPVPGPAMPTGAALPAAALPTPPAGTCPTAEIERLVAQGVASQVIPLREALDRYEDRVRIADVLGGLGAILGLFGLWSLFRRNRGAGP